jgi:hypothetical protein
MERILKIGTGIFLLVLMGPTIAASDTVGVNGESVYVTRSDCMALVRHHPSADATYQPGVDVHGKYVAPADLPAGNTTVTLPDKVQFDLKINPVTYGKTTANATSSNYANTAMSVAHVSVDLKTGQTLLNGKPLDGDQDQYVVDACRKAGFR